MSRSVRPTDYRQPAQPTHRVEWFGSLQVWQPIRPTVHEAAKEMAVACV